MKVLLGVSFLLLALGAEAGAVEPFKGAVDCITAARDCSAGAASFIKAGVVDLVLIPSVRQGHDGFYVFASEDAYFHEFPAAPPPVELIKRPPPSLWNLYGFITRLWYKDPPKPNPYVHYKIEAGIHEPVYVAFKRQETGELKFESATTTAGPSGTVYLPGLGGQVLADLDSRELISREALGRIRNVYSTYLSSPEPAKGDVLNEVNIAGHEPVRQFFNRDVCRKALEVCSTADELKGVAAAELAKFK